MKIWIKLYTEILDDAKMGRLPNHIWRRAVELFLLAGRTGTTGQLPPVEDMAWVLRLSQDKLLEDLTGLAEVGVVHEAKPGDWFVTHFAERQDADSMAERKAHQRERDRTDALFRHEPVTNGDGEEKKNRGEKKREEENALRAPPSPPSPPSSAFSDSETAQFVTAFGDNHARDAEKLYRQVTGQVSIPPDQRDKALETLESILDFYRQDFEKAMSAGKPIFSAWCNTRGKNTRLYSPVNTAWLTKWLERIAERPPQDNVAGLAERIRMDIERVHSS